MPWTTATAPDSVKDRYSERCLAVWVKVANSELDESGDEGRAIRVANTAANNCKASGKAMVPMKAQVLDSEEMEAWFTGRIPRRLLAIPFGGPIPAAKAPRGVDLDGEWFSERTDIYGPYRVLRENRERLVDFMHGADKVLERAIVGKAVLDAEPEEDGWWESVWLKAQEARLALIKRFQAAGGILFGSSEAVYKKATPDGEITEWPYWRQTLAPTPQNTFSILRPAKAALEEANEANIELATPLKAWLAELDALGADLPQTFPDGSDAAATAMRLTERMPDLLEAWGIRKP